MNDGSAAILVEVEDFGDALMYSSHEGRRKFSDGALHQTAIVDGSELIDQQVGVLPQTVYCGHTMAKRLGGVYQISGARDNQHRRMVGIEHCVGLDDQDGSQFFLVPFLAFDPDWPARPPLDLGIRGPAQWRQTRDERAGFLFALFSRPRLSV